MDFFDNVFFLDALSKGIDKLALRIHEVYENGMVYQVIACRVRVGRGREVDAVRFACRFYGFIGPDKAGEGGMEIFQILTNPRRRVSCWVYRDEYRLEYFTMVFFCVPMSINRV